MKPPIDHERLLEMILAGTPGRVVDIATYGDPETIADVDATREALASLGLALEPVAPSPSLREKIAASIASHPRVHSRRAVLVLDMLVDHLTPGRPLEVPRARDIVPALKARLAAARKLGEPVIYLCDRHEPGDPDLETWGGHNVAGTPGAEVWPEIAPEPGDRVVTHRTYSAFHETELEATLRELNVDTLVLTGCIAELGIFLTAADAMMRGFTVEVPPDCQAGNSPIGEQVILTTLSVMRPVEPVPRT